MLRLTFSSGDDAIFHDSIMEIQRKNKGVVVKVEKYDELLLIVTRHAVNVSHHNDESRGKKNGSMPDSDFPLSDYPAIREEFLSWGGTKKRWYDDMLMNAIAASKNYRWVEKPTDE